MNQQFQNRISTQIAIFSVQYFNKIMYMIYLMNMYLFERDKNSYRSNNNSLHTWWHWNGRRSHQMTAYKCGMSWYHLSHGCHHRSRNCHTDWRTRHTNREPLHHRCMVHSLDLFLLVNSSCLLCGRYCDCQLLQQMFS